MYTHHSRLCGCQCEHMQHQLLDLGSSQLRSQQKLIAHNVHMPCNVLVHLPRSCNRINLITVLTARLTKANDALTTRRLQCTSYILASLHQPRPLVEADKLFFITDSHACTPHACSFHNCSHHICGLHTCSFHISIYRPQMWPVDIHKSCILPAEMG